MDNTGKIVGINLFVFLIYTLLLQSTTNSDTAFLGATVICCHVICLFIVGIFMAFSSEEHYQGGGYLLSAFLIAIIGFLVFMGPFIFH